MGRKPVVGLVGACLAGLALSGCSNNNATWPGGSRKDTQPPGGSATTAWNQQRQAQNSGGNASVSGAPVTSGSGMNSSMAGTQAVRPDALAAGGAGSLNTSARPPVDPYPTATSAMQNGNSGAGVVERASYPGSDMTAGRATAPPSRPVTGAGDPNAPGLPPLTGAPAPGGPGTRPAPPTLSQLGPPEGPPRPRMDDITVAPNGQAAVAVPRVSTGLTPSAPPAAPMPAPLPPPGLSTVGAPPSGPAVDLPPIPVPPPAPVTPTTAGLQSPPLPAPPPFPRGSGVPGLPQNQATMQGGGPAPQ